MKKYKRNTTENEKIEQKRSIKQIGNKTIATWEVIWMAMWNIRNSTGKKEELIEEITKLYIDYTGITETNNKSKGSKQLPRGYRMYWWGIKEDNIKSGVVIIVKEKKSIKKINFINESYITYNITKKNWIEEYTLIIAFRLNEDTRKDETDKFYNKLQQEIDKNESKSTLNRNKSIKKLER